MSDYCKKYDHSQFYLMLLCLICICNIHTVVHVYDVSVTDVLKLSLCAIDASIAMEHYFSLHIADT